MMAVVVDNTVLSNFAHVEQPLLFRAAFNNLMTVPAVLDELAEGVRLNRMPDVDWGWLPVSELTDSEQSLANQFGQTLGRGESECIALAKSRDWMVLTDDRDARKAAQTAGVPVSGTLGCLINLIDGGILSITEADRLLELMKHRGYRCPVDSLSELTGE